MKWNIINLLDSEYESMEKALYLRGLEGLISSDDMELIEEQIVDEYTRAVYSILDSAAMHGIEIEELDKLAKVYLGGLAQYTEVI